MTYIPVANEHGLVQSARGAGLLCLLGVEKRAVRRCLSRYSKCDSMVTKPVCLEVADWTLNGASGVVAVGVVSTPSENEFHATYSLSKLSAFPTSTLVTPSSPDFSSRMLSSSIQVGSLAVLSSVTRLVC